MSSSNDSASASRDRPFDTSVETLAAVSQLDFDIAFFDAILRRAPDYVDVLRRQGEQLSRRGCHERALEVDRRLVLLLPVDGVARYNLACSLALSGLTKEALVALQRALECGYDDFEYLKRDGDLDSLRDEPAFLDLIREFSAPR